MHTVSLDSSCLQRDRRLIASVTKAAKIFCVRGCLRKGVQLCALSRRARVCDEGGFPPLRARRRPPLHARMSGEALRRRLLLVLWRRYARPRCVLLDARETPLRVLVDPHLHARTSGEALRRRCSWCAGDAMRDPAACSSTPALVRLERWYRVEQGMGHSRTGPYARASVAARAAPSALCAPGPGARDKFTK